MKGPGRIVALLLMTLGLLLQTNAPAQASAMARAAADPLSGVIICSAHSQTKHAPASPERQHKQLCADCLVCCGAAQAVLDDAPALPLPGEAAAVAHRPFTLAQPRAPPAILARARGPPLPA